MGFEARKLKAVLLRTLTEADTPETRQMADEHFIRHGTSPTRSAR